MCIKVKQALVKYADSWDSHLQTSDIQYKAQGLHSKQTLQMRCRKNDSQYFKDCVEIITEASIMAQCIKLWHLLQCLFKFWLFHFQSYFLLLSLGKQIDLFGCCLQCKRPGGSSWLLFWAPSAEVIGERTSGQMISVL